MTNQLPKLAFDGVLCDRPQPGASLAESAIMRETTLVTKRKRQCRELCGIEEVRSHAKKLVARLLGQDAAIDDETTGRLKEFLKSRLSGADHEAVCSMLDGEPDVEAQDDIPENAAGGPLPKKASLAGDLAGFAARFPGLAHIKIDNSGIQPRARGGSYSDAAAKSFADRYPGLQGIKQA